MDVQVFDAVVSAALSERGDGLRGFSVRTQQDGTFSAGGLAPGAYYVYASCGQPILPARGPFNGQVPVLVHAQSPVELRVRVHGVSGQHVPKYYIEIVRVDWRGAKTTHSLGTGDATGADYYRTKLPKWCEVVVTVAANGHRGEQRVGVGGSEHQNVDVHLR